MFCWKYFKNTSYKIVLQAGFLAIAMIPCVSAIEPTRVLILPFENATSQTELNSLKNGIPDLLTASLEARSEEIQVVERQKLEAIMVEQSLKWENVMKDKAYGRLGQLAQAQYILRGSVMPDPQGLRIQAILYETETTRLVRTWETTGAKKSLSDMSDKLAGQVALTMRGKGRELEADPDPQTNLFLMHGMAYYHQNQFSKAIPEFMKVLEKRPRHADAKYWLVKSYQAADLKADAALEAKEFVQFFPNDRRVKEIQGVKP